METVLYYLEKGYNTIKANGIYIFLSVFFVFLLFVVSDVSDDFIYALGDKGNIYNIFLIALAFLLLTISLWIIPGAFLKIFLGSDTEPKIVEFYYRGFEKIYNGKRNKKRNQIPVKYIAIAPWIVYTTTLVICLIKSTFELNKEWWYIFIFLGVLVLSFLVLEILNQKSRKLYYFFIGNRANRKLFKRIVMFFIVIAILPLLLFLATYIFKDLELELSTKRSYHQFLIGLIIYNFLCIWGTFLFLIYKEKERAATRARYEFSRKVHRATLIVNTTLLLFFCLLSLFSNLIWVSPTVILIIISSVLVLVFELLYTTPRIIIIIDHNRKYPTTKYDWQQYIFPVSLVLLVILFLILPDKQIYMVEGSNKKIFQFKEDSKTLIDNRDTLEDKFYEWLCHNHHIDDEGSNEPIDVVLISGQGGGSTAGTWLLSGLLNADAVNPQFYKSIFSISTVSGSSNGANFYLAIKTKNILPDDTGAGFTDGKRDNLVREIYNRNYFSSNFLGLMFSDFSINPLVSLFYDINVDRNYILQREETRAMLDAAEAIKIKDFNTVKSYFDQDYFDLWYKEKDPSKPLNPLFFINTTLMNTGEKAIFSPVKLCNQGIRARDIVQEFAKTDEGRNHYIPISAAVAQSQAFPILSTYNLVPGTGYLGDGGFYENTGTSTTLAIYKKLKRYYKDHLLKWYPNRKIRFIMMCFVSEKEVIPPGEENPYNIFGKSMVYYTISQTYKTPFKGHAEDAVETLRQETAPEDKFLAVENPEKFATTRLISRKTINEMLALATEKKGAAIIINYLKDVEAERGKNAVNAKADSIFTHASTVYINYKEDVDRELVKDVVSYISKEASATISKNGKKKDYVFTVPGYQEASSESNVIRYFHKSDEKLADRLQKALHKRNINIKVERFGVDSGRLSRTVPEGQLDIRIKSLNGYKKYNETAMN